MKFKSLFLGAIAAVSAWAVQAEEFEVLSNVADDPSGTWLWAGLGLMVVMAVRSYR